MGDHEKLQVLPISGVSENVRIQAQRIEYLGWGGGGGGGGGGGE